MGNYLNYKEKSADINEKARRHVISLLEHLNMLKDYKEETLFIAVSLVDRFLVNIAVGKKKLPCLLTLVLTCTLLSAKLEEALQPSFKKLLRLVDDEWKI